MNIALDSLREQIAQAVANAKAYDVPAVCVRVGIQKIEVEEDRAEAYNSKRLYVKSRLKTRTPAELLQIGQSVLTEFSDETLADTISEMTLHTQHRVSQLVRMDIIKELNSLDQLFGDLQPLDELAKIFGEAKIKDDTFGTSRLASLEGQIIQWYVKNSDWSHQDLLTHCGALTCSQTRFFRLLETLLHPMIRRDAEQAALAKGLDIFLKRDGFTIRPVGSESGYAVYGIVRALAGVSGQMKNLIFASIGEKPELVIRDAVNNDVEIIKNADNVLVFDRPLPSGGLLLWSDLVEWWAETHGIQDGKGARAPLYRRLRQAVRGANSPGELAIFHTYYEQYGPRFVDRLPALIPQVYLHYDPYTKRQRGEEAILARQRMDFLLMLNNGARIVIEIDGRHHYADESPPGSGNYVASPRKYAEMTSEDRRLRSSGYEVYRFGAYEFSDVDLANGKIGDKSQQTVIEFFDRLLEQHGVK